MRPLDRAIAAIQVPYLYSRRLTPWLTGAGSRRLEGTNIGHENAEGMAYVGVRVEPTVRLGSVVESVENKRALQHFLICLTNLTTES